MRTLVRNIGSLATPRLQGSGPDVWTSQTGPLSITVDEGIIQFIGPEHNAQGPFDTVFDAGGRLVSPGLIDAHTHPVFGSNRCAEFEMRVMGRTYEEIAASGGGIRSTVKATRNSTDDDLDLALSRHLGWMLACGTTVAEAKSGYGLSMDCELRQLEAIQRAQQSDGIFLIPTFLAAHAIPVEFEGNPDGYLAHAIDDILPVVAKKGLAAYVDIFVEKNYFQKAHAKRLAEAAWKWGLGLRMHVDQLSDSQGAALAADLGAKAADHLEQTSSEGIARLAASSTIPVLLPASVYCLGKSKYPDARAMLAAGLSVVLATDFNPGSSPTPSLPFVMSLACTQMRMTPAEAWLGVTSHAARSLDLHTKLGVVEAGFLGDLVIWDAEDYREVPYWVGANLVYAVFKNGNLVYGAHRLS